MGKLENVIDTTLLGAYHDELMKGKTKNITYSALKTLRDGSKLIPGQWYRIIDYTTTTVQANTQSAGHVFDVIVRADDVNVINENAYAALHSGDTYFSTAGAKLEAWELKYCIDNNTNRFAWADSTNGKGVIWWMKDENGNECPYDFKNIMFKFTSAISQSGIVANVFYYTFSVATGTNDATVTDNSLNGVYCHGNKMGVYIDSNKQQLNSNVFRNLTVTNYCRNNTFGNNCNSNTFGYSCYSNTFGNSCQNNTFGYKCYSNTFGNNCNSNTFGNSCQNNTFGNECYRNTFGSSCNSNTFGNSCQNNTFGHDCNYNTFGNECRYIKFGIFSATMNYCQYIIVENGNQELYLNCSATTSASLQFQNVKIAQGVNNTNNYKTITHTTAGDMFQTVYKPANSQIISI